MRIPGGLVFWESLTRENSVLPHGRPGALVPAPLVRGKSQGVQSPEGDVEITVPEFTAQLS